VTDKRLRDLERRFAESGAVADEVALLHERLRIGAVDRRRLEVAAYAGSAAARATLGEGAQVPTAARTGVRGFVRKLEPWGPLPSLRAAIAATRMIVKDCDGALDDVVMRRLHLAEEYAVAPTRDLIAAIDALPDSVVTDARGRACALCAFVVHLTMLSTNHFSWKAKNATEVVAKEVGGEKPVRAAVLAELLPWALGQRNRARARRGAALTDRSSRSPGEGPSGVRELDDRRRVSVTIDLERDVDPRDPRVVAWNVAPRDVALADPRGPRGLLRPARRIPPASSDRGGNRRERSQSSRRASGALVEAVKATNAVCTVGSCAVLSAAGTAALSGIVPVTPNDLAARASRDALSAPHIGGTL
jgi:hypothetical protein